MIFRLRTLEENQSMTAIRIRNSVDSPEATKAILDWLRSQPRKACFITEMRASLDSVNINAEQIERTLSDLEAQGAVIIRDHYCADPHLDGIDLRIVGLIDDVEAEEPQLSAIREIDKAWDQWLTSYLANHRCG
jgi:hypothetical protein